MRKTLFNPRDDFQTANMLGLFSGVGAASSFAVEDGLLADTPVILGTGTPTPLLPPDTGTAALLLSTDVGNAGAVIVLNVLDAEFKPRTVTVEITGAGDFPILDPDTGQNLQITRLNGAVNVGARGTGEVEADIVVHELGTPANVYGTITAASQEMQQAVFTVPAGFTWAVSSLVASMRKSGGADTDVTITLVGGAVGTVMRRPFGFGLQRSGDTSIEFVNSELEGGGTPVDLMLEVESSAAGAGISARITLRLVEN